MEIILTIAVIDVHDERKNMSDDVPNAFIQPVVPNGNEQVIMKITLVLIDVLV